MTANGMCSPVGSEICIGDGGRAQMYIWLQEIVNLAGLPPRGEWSCLTRRKCITTAFLTGRPAASGGTRGSLSEQVRWSRLFGQVPGRIS